MKVNNSENMYKKPDVNTDWNQALGDNVHDYYTKSSDVSTVGTRADSILPDAWHIITKTTSLGSLANRSHHFIQVCTIIIPKKDRLFHISLVLSYTNLEYSRFDHHFSKTRKHHHRFMKKKIVHGLSKYYSCTFVVFF